MFFSRGKNKVQDPYTIRDTYLFYIEDIGNNELYYIDYKLYRDIVCDFYKSMAEGILTRNISFKLPFNLGSLKVRKKKIALERLGILGVDWKKTVATGKYIYYLNEHSRGYKYFFYWEKRNRIVKNLFFYRFVLTRENKRYLAKLIKSGKYDYFEM